MRRMKRIVLLVAIVALTPALTGCENFDLDKLDVFGLNDKKKLPGDRKPLFPEGVPGVSQGIPPEFVKGNQPPEGTDTPQVALPAEPAKAATVDAEQPKPKPKRKPKLAKQKLLPDNGPPPAQAQQPAAWPTQSQQPPPQQSSGAGWPSSQAPGAVTH
jgi:hypothetical protein